MQKTRSLFQGPIKALFWAVTVYVLLTPISDAFATTKLGDVITNSQRNIMPALRLMEYVSYILGAFLVVRGLMKLKEHAEQGDRSPLSHALLHLFGGTFLASLPFLATTLQNTLRLGPTAGTIRAANLTGGGATLSLDVMLINFVDNIQRPIYLLLSVLGVLIGVYLLVTGFLRLARNGGQDGPRNSFGAGTIGRLVIGSAMASIGSTTDIFTNTLFGGNVVTFSGLDPSIGLGDTTRLAAAISAGLVFFQIIGFIAFMRGLLMLRAIADGGQASTAAAFTHLFGGAAAFNIAPMLQIIQRTLGISVSVLQF